jgi:hypothetical protein
MRGFVVALLLCACGSPLTEEDAGPDGGMASLDAGEPDAGTEIDGGPLVGYGRIFVYRQSISVAFHRSTDGLENCTSFDRLPCEIERCAAEPVEAMPPHAGAIEIETNGTPVATLSPDVNGFYMIPAIPTPLWTGGESVRIHAPGAEVPAFDMSYLGVTPLEITQPDFSTLTTIDRSVPFEIQWTPVSGAGVTLAFVQSGLQIRCYFATDAGTGSAPTAALSELTPGMPGTLAVIVEDRHILTPPGWRIRTATRNDAMQNGTRLFQAVNVQ